MELISQQEAISKNLLKYFTGKPCKYNHICERYTKKSTCIECSKIDSRNRIGTPSRKLYNRQYKQKRLEKDILYRTWEMAKQRAKKQNVIFEISKKDILEVFPLDGKCPILGIILKRNFDRAQDDSPSLDRIIPSKGYIKGNIAIISRLANTIKNKIDDSNVFRKIADWIDSQKEIM